MPHYEDGTEAKVGDDVSCLGHYNKIKHGIVTAVLPGTDTCNLTLAHMQVIRPYANPEAIVISQGLATATAKECKKLD